MKKKLATAIGLIALGTVFECVTVYFLWENFLKNSGTKTKWNSNLLEPRKFRIFIELEWNKLALC